MEQTEWHRVELWDNLATIAEQYLKKGNQVYFAGVFRLVVVRYLGRVEYLVA